ncbi:hypothetical protein BRE01_34490 [Brevibacillus reuszeri]|uniref:Uncharacterized protein n=1 Tax=Brevibacillus reuszeri TaxID=54915 RepID=A0A0K9YXS1_9BACL|nr:DUF5701 family protein [Brevibacillus reuszeri]KNB73447.1 hypothetical protein ADS79_05710 [Brevibacillus reuszeri]MED1858767.1 DUF5701 family protein [Brevibacillus reuszeri]GED69747.1 hypothetical protein BRE01_34490 [Brevibacillus reuszeri]
MLQQEFERQINNFIQKGYLSITGHSEEDFRKQLEPLRKKVVELEHAGVSAQKGKVPFVIVIKRDWIDSERAMQLVERKNKVGFSIMASEEINRFTSIKGIELPEGIAYLLVDIDTGQEMLNVTPNQAMEMIKNENRSPLTIEEGVALITHFPEVVKKNNGFSLLGSRCGDKRVTALWISEGRPKLGWCWAGNPHTWLGSASCQYRFG